MAVQQFLDRAGTLTDVEASLREASAFVGSLPETADIVILSEADLRKQAEQQSIMQSEESRLRCLCEMWDVRSKIIREFNAPEYPNLLESKLNV